VLERFLESRDVVLALVWNHFYLSRGKKRERMSKRRSKIERAGRKKIKWKMEEPRKGGLA